MGARCTRSNFSAPDFLALESMPEGGRGGRGTVRLNAAQQGLVNLPYLDLPRQCLFPLGGAARSRGARLIRVAGCKPTPPRQLPPGPAPQALVGSLGTLFVLSCTCMVARQLGLSCNTLARARRVFLFPSCSESFLRSCTRIAFAFPP